MVEKSRIEELEEEVKWLRSLVDWLKANTNFITTYPIYVPTPSEPWTHPCYPTWNSTLTVSTDDKRAP